MIETARTHFAREAPCGLYVSRLKSIQLAHDDERNTGIAWTSSILACRVLNSSMVALPFMGVGPIELQDRLLTVNYRRPIYRLEEVRNGCVR